MLWKCAATLITCSFLISAAMAQQPAQQPSRAIATYGSANSAIPAIVPANRPSIGLALEGGGALGLAHVGVLKWFEEHRIPVDRISGTSMGALVGGLYATGSTPTELRALALSDAFSYVFALQTPYADASFRRRQDRHEMPQSITVGLKKGIQFRNAVFSDGNLNDFLTLKFFAYNSREFDFNRMPIPFRCVATDLNTLQSVTFSGGPVAQAVRASISIPGVFSPVQDRFGHYLVDGGILDNLPTSALKHELHADIVLAVHLDDSAMSSVDTHSIVSVLNRAFAAGIAHNVEQAERLADTVVKVPVASFSATDYDKAAQLMDAGYRAAEQDSSALLKYALSAEDWKAYLAAREERRLAQPGLQRPALLTHVLIDGGEPGAVGQVFGDMNPLIGRPIAPAPTFNALKTIQSNGGFAATFETFNPTADAGSPDTGIYVHLSRDHTGPPYLLIGPELAASTSNITRESLTFRLVDQNLGGFGSELRATAHIGYMTDISAEYYRQLTLGGYFIEPHARAVREPVYIWANQKRVAERFQQNLEAGLEAGRTINRHLQVSAEWRAVDTRWSLKEGAGGGPYLSGTAQTGLVHFDLDQSAAGAVSPKGYRFAASAGAFFHAEGSENAPLVRLAFSRTRQFRETNIFGIGGEINSYLRARVAEPYRFTLGGPMRLSASSFDEYRGTDTWLVRSGMMHRIAALPTGLGQGIYAAFTYEAGEVWSPDARALLRQDGATGLVANTPLGLVTFGVSVGDAGRRKVFVTVGRWF